MATLTSDDYKWMSDWVRQNPEYKTILKNSGMSRPQVYDAWQAIETYSVGSYSVTPLETLRDAIDTATGITPTTPQNTMMWYAWSAWKAQS